MKRNYSKIIILNICTIALILINAGYTEALEVKTDQFHSYLKAGIDKAFNLETDCSITYLKKAIALEPENPTGYAYMAILHLFSYEMCFDMDSRKKNQETISYYVSEAISRGEKKLANNNKDSQTYMAMALAKIANTHWMIHEKRYLVMAQETANIWNYLEKAREADPQNYDIYFLMGLLHYHIDHLPGVTRFLSSVLITSGDSRKGLKEIELAAQKGDLLQTIALTELQSVYLIFEKQPELALPVVRGLRDRFPNNYNFLFALGNTHAELNHFDEALTIARDIERNIKLGKSPYVPQLQSRYNQLMGRIFFKKGNYDQAADYFQKTLADRSFYNSRVRVSSLVRLGMIQDIRKDRTKAEEYYSRALLIDGGEGTAQVEARKYLQTPYAPQVK